MNNLKTLNFRDDNILLYDFYCLASENSITDVADKNFTSRSNISRNISKLEKKLNCTLINRSNKGITLTKDGELLYKKLKNTNYFNLFQNKEEDAGYELCIGTTRNIADNKLINYLNDFHKLYPTCHINILTDNASNLNTYLTEHKIDILIDYLPNMHFSSDSDFNVIALDKFKTCFACSLNFYNKINENINSLKDIEKYNLIISGKSRRRQLLDQFLQENNISIRPLIEMPDSKLMIDFVQDNEFIGYFVEDEIANTDLKIIEFKEQLPTNSIGLVTSTNTINSMTEAFVKSITN